MTWFEDLTGFPERSPTQVRAKLKLDGTTMTSLANGRIFTQGVLETPSLAELRARVSEAGVAAGKATVREVVADVQKLHVDGNNANALFQVASQFNLLEMVSPDVTPERGVSGYSGDKTQGPACAVAAGAGTIYRNYFAEVAGERGQSESRQIDCLAAVGAALANAERGLWEMRNGYVITNGAGLAQINLQLQAMNDIQRDELRGLLRIGLQWQTEVTLSAAGHLVSQVYGSALPVAYNATPEHLWESFARLVLEASYEATICAALLNSIHHGSPVVYLTLLGGGVFGNDMRWIIDAIARAVKLYNNYDLDIAIVSYGRANPQVGELINRLV